MPKWAKRFIKTRNQRELEMILAGRPARIMWNPLFDKRGTGSRAVFLASIDIGKSKYSVMFQHYREGYVFNNHTDGIGENKVVTLTLHKPKEGGRFYVNGPLRTYLRERIAIFDGGRYHHGVTPIVKGSRTVLMLQKARDV